MNNKSIILVLIIGLLSLCVYLGAQDPAGKEATPEIKDGLLEVTIDDFRGTVEVKEDLNKDWVKAQKGMKLKEGAKVSTGFRSKVSLLFTDNSVFVVKSLTQMTITRFLQEKDTIETKIKLRIGNIRLKVKEDQPVKTDLKVTTPNATCSVRGTDVKGIKTSPDMGDNYSVNSGHVRMKNVEGRTRSLRGGESTNQNLIHPIEHALLLQVVNILPFGSTVAERMNTLTSITVPILPDVLIGDLNSENGNPVVEGDIYQETGDGDYGGGCDFTAPSWYEGCTCPICGVHPCECCKCPYCGYPYWCCICEQ